MACSAWSGTQSSASAISDSSYKRVSKGDNGEMDQSLKAKLAMKGKCSKCSKDIALYKRYNSDKINKTAFTKCSSATAMTIPAALQTVTWLMNLTSLRQPLNPFSWLLLEQILLLTFERIIHRMPPFPNLLLVVLNLLMQ